MRAKGIGYDTGFIYQGSVSRERFDPGVVRLELAIIRDDLHCNAVQVAGGDPDRLEQAARCAAELGLEVWFSPYPLELTPEEILALFTDCAQRAERLRKAGAEVVFVAGVELTIMNRGFVPGNTLEERLSGLLAEPGRGERLAEVVAGQYRDAVRNLAAGEKPVAITGFGACAYVGATDRGARAMEIVEYDEATQAPVRLDGEYTRDEAGQAADIREVLEIFDAEGVDRAFVWLFELCNFPHRPHGDPRDDLDLASPAIVKTLEGGHGDTYPDMTWEPKAAFTAIADCYRG